MALAPFLQPNSVSRSVAEIIRPAQRMKPSEACEEYLQTEKGPWRRSMAPMMVEPLDLLATREYTGICYVGPSRSSKTMSLVLGALTWIVTCSPGDTQINHITQDLAREFSKKDLDRAIRHSPELASRLSPRPRDDNVFDKFFRSGMALTMGWPTTGQLSGKTLKYVLTTDYDRAEDREDIGGEGSYWDLSYARIRTLMSRGKNLAESSPGGEYDQANWRPSTAHEAPPATGIISIYNRGTRARWYWQCTACSEYFQAKPGLECFPLPPDEQLEQDVQSNDLMWLAEQFAKVVCTHCGTVHGQELKEKLNAGGVWLHEGESIDGGGRRSGERRRTDIASYWQGGCSATYQRWDQLLLGYLQGLLTYAQTGDESTLKTKTNTDLAMPHLPRAIAKRRGAEQLIARAENWPRGLIPQAVRFLTASVDVQGNRFVVQVHGWGAHLESWVIERFTITASRRKEGTRDAALEPAAFVEDWDVILELVADREYAYVEALEQKLRPRLTLVDSGGKAGVTMRAYEFWRSARDKGYGRRVMLVRGTGAHSAARCSLTWPDTRGRGDRQSGAVGDVPVFLINTNILKDGVSNDYGREKPGPGYVHVPTWIERTWFDELLAESRGKNGWESKRGSRNEAFDLHVYARVACIALEAEKIDWNAPPPWAAPFELRAAGAARAAPGRSVRHPGIT